MKAAAALAILCCVAACGGEERRGHVLSTASATEPPRVKDPAERAAAATGAPANGGGETAHARLPGDTLALRFVELAPQAHIEGDLAAAWRAITEHPQRSLLPYGLKSGPRAYRAVQMAFSDADVESYAALDDARSAARAPQPVRRLDPVWNRRRAVYQSRQALFVPSGASHSYRVAMPANARLETALGLLSPSQAPARFRVTVDGATVLDEVVTIPGKWIGREVDLSRVAGREAEVRFSVDSTAGSVHGFFADPVLWSSGGGAPGPNVLFILLDTLRVDATAVMPRLQQYATRAARFDQDITAAAWTRPSMLAMYGGDCPTAVGQAAEKIVPEDGDRKRFYRLAPALLPRLLGARGYRVSAIGNNFFLLGYPAIGLDLGFAEVDDIRHPVKDTPAITRSAIRFLERNKDRSFFLHLHYDGTHWPYTPPEKYLARKVLAGWKGDPLLDRDPMWQQYLGEAAYTDEYVAQVLGALDRLGLAQRTLVIIVGDHGEIFDRRHDHVVEALGFRTQHHHGWSGYDELLRVPLVIGMPGTVAPAVVAQQVRSFDIAPTVLDFVGVTDATLPGRGRSLRPLMEGRTEPEERVAFTEGQNIRVVRADGWAYLRREDPRLVVRGGSAARARGALRPARRSPPASQPRRRRSASAGPHAGAVRARGAAAARRPADRLPPALGARPEHPSRRGDTGDGGARVGPWRDGRRRGGHPRRRAPVADEALGTGWDRLQRGASRRSRAHRAGARRPAGRSTAGAGGGVRPPAPRRRPGAADRRRSPAAPRCPPCAAAGDPRRSAALAGSWSSGGRGSGRRRRGCRRGHRDDGALGVCAAAGQGR